MLKNLLLITTMFLSSFFISAQEASAVRINIQGAGQSHLNLSVASPLTAPNVQANILGAELDNTIKYNLSFLPFVKLTNTDAILGGTVLAGWQANNIDFKRFQIAGADLLITQAWTNGDDENSEVQIRVFETYSGQFVFGNSYANVTSETIDKVADQFCSEFMRELTGRGEFFKSTLAFAKDVNQKKRDIWIVKPTGRDLLRITNLAGVALSPAWSPDGRYVVFSHIDDSTHGLGVWDRTSNNVRRIRFPGNTVIGPSFMPNNKVAVGLSTATYPDIFLLNYKFEKEMALEQSSAINVSPNFDASGSKMVFTSNRLGGPQIFLKNLRNGLVSRVSLNGSYNTEPTISPDGTLVAFSRLTSSGNRIFVQDLLTGQEKQITFGPGNDEQPAFAPDGYFLAFSSSRKGQKQIYLTTRHGGDAKHIPTGSGAATFPRWGMIPE